MVTWKLEHDAQYPFQLFSVSDILFNVITCKKLIIRLKIEIGNNKDLIFLFSLAPETHVLFSVIKLCQNKNPVSFSSFCSFPHFIGCGFLSGQDITTKCFFVPLDRIK